jgi:hypothetical protein
MVSTTRTAFDLTVHMDALPGLPKVWRAVRTIT